MVPHPAARRPPGRSIVDFTQGEERHYTRDVLNRRKALVGYLTYRFVRLVLRREATRRVEAGDYSVRVLVTRKPGTKPIEARYTVAHSI